MADIDDSVSMVGLPPFRRHAIGRFLWGRRALEFAGISVEEHERLARKLGDGVVAEVLLLVIARQCGTNMRKWQEARYLGIPWQTKRWTSLTGLQRDYNDVVAKTRRRLDSFDEDAALSGSSARDSPRGASSAGADPPPARILHLRGATAWADPPSAWSEEEEWPEPKVSAETARE